MKLLEGYTVTACGRLRKTRPGRYYTSQRSLWPSLGSIGEADALWQRRDLRRAP